MSDTSTWYRVVILNDDDDTYEHVVSEHPTRRGAERVEDAILSKGLGDGYFVDVIEVTR